MKGCGDYYNIIGLQFPIYSFYNLLEMGAAASVPSLGGSREARQSPPQSRPKRMSLLGSTLDAASTMSKSNFSSAPPMTPDTVKFLTKIFEDLFCLDCGFENPLQASLLLDVIKYASFKEGDYLMKQGDVGHEMFIIENGDVEVVVNGETVRHLRRGAVVGEIAMLYDAPRNASIRCLTYTSCYFLARRDFKSIQEITAATNVARRTEWMHGLPEFSVLGNMELYRIVQSLQQVELKEGDFLYEEGRLTNRIYVIETGTAEAKTSNSLEEAAAIRAREGFAFHSTSVLANNETIAMVDERFPELKNSCKFSQKFCSFAGDPANTAVQAFDELPPSTNPSEDGTEQVDTKEAVDYGVLLESEPDKQQELSAMEKKEAFTKAAAAIPSFCDDVFYSPGSILGISVIKAKANSENKNASDEAIGGGWNWEETWNVLPDGSEEKIVGAQAPFNVVVTSGTATVLFFTVDVLHHIFGSLHALWLELESCVKENRKYIYKDIAEDTTEVNAITVRRRFVLSSFQQICFIKEDSNGSFSSLARYIDGDGGQATKVYSLVHRSKYKIAEHNHVKRTMDEINILSQLSSPFVVELAGLSTTRDEIVFVFENMGASDLWSYIYEYSASRDKPDMAQLQCLLVSIIKGLDHIHVKGVSYRELKPENISIDKFGRIKLCDFASAKVLPFTKVLPSGQVKIQTKSFTLVGTPGLNQYIREMFYLLMNYDVLPVTAR